MVKFLKVQIQGLEKVRRDFRNLKNKGPLIQKEFMRLISESTLSLLRANTPVDTGELRDGWTILNRGPNYIDVGFREQFLADRLFFVTEGNRFTPPNLFLKNVQDAMLDTVMDTLQGTLRRHHRYFRNVNLHTGNRLAAGGGIGTGRPAKVGKGIGGKGRKFQQVGRTKASLTGHRQVGGAQVKRVGRGTKRLGRRLSLRRRRGKDARSTVKALLG